jgi:hypothetical protein
MYDAYLDPKVTPTPDAFIAEIAEEGYGPERHPDHVPFEELWGSWACLQELIQEAREVASTLTARDKTPADKMVREIARRPRLADRVSREELSQAEGQLSREDLVEAFKAYRQIEAQAIDVMREQAPACVM